MVMYWNHEILEKILLQQKKYPEGVFEMKSMLNNNPDITMDATNPANV